MQLEWSWFSKKAKKVENRFVSFTRRFLQRVPNKNKHRTALRVVFIYSLTFRAYLFIHSFIIYLFVIHVFIYWICALAEFFGRHGDLSETTECLFQEKWWYSISRITIVVWIWMAFGGMDAYGTLNNPWLDSCVHSNWRTRAVTYPYTLNILKCFNM